MMNNPWFIVRFFHKIHARLNEVFLCSDSEVFRELSVLLLGDFLQLPPLKGKQIYSNMTMDLLICQILFGLGILMKILRSNQNRRL